MFLHRLELNNFRNYSSLKLEFNKTGAFFYGPNGSGKTNILEAVHLLSMFKSFRSNISNEHLINWNSKSSTVYAMFEDSTGLTNEVVLQIDKKKNCVR